MEEFYLERFGATYVLYVKKEVDHHLAGKIRKEVDRLIDKGSVKCLVIDFENVDFMDSAGIGMIMGRYKKLQFFGGKVKVSGIRPELQRIFSMSGIFKMIPQYKTATAALEQNS